MTINKIKNGGSLILCPEGRLDTVTAPELEKIINEELAGVTELILDFKGLSYISSAGLRVLLSARKKMDAQGTMTVKNVNETIKEIFELTGFADFLNIE